MREKLYAAGQNVVLCMNFVGSNDHNSDNKDTRGSREAANLYKVGINYFSVEERVGNS